MTCCGPLDPLTGKPAVRIETRRFILRPLRPGDERALFPAFASEEVCRYWSREPFESEEELAGWLFDPAWTGRAWGAIPREGGGPVARLIAKETNTQVTEVGYMVVPEWQRQGVARECLAALIGYLFAAEGWHRLWADVDPDNAPSNRLLESLGFTREGHLRECWHTHLGWRDTWLWGLLARDWAAAAKSGSPR